MSVQLGRRRSETRLTFNRALAPTDYTYGVNLRAIAAYLIGVAVNFAGEPAAAVYDLTTRTPKLTALAFLLSQAF